MKKDQHINVQTEQAELVKTNEPKVSQARNNMVIIVTAPGQCSRVIPDDKTVTQRHSLDDKMMRTYLQLGQTKPMASLHRHWLPLGRLCKVLWK